nr:hypothetical protein [Kribbella albertanoniae]
MDSGGAVERDVGLVDDPVDCLGTEDAGVLVGEPLSGPTQHHVGVE